MEWELGGTAGWNRGRDSGVGQRSEERGGAVGGADHQSVGGAAQIRLSHRSCDCVMKLSCSVCSGQIYVAFGTIGLILFQCSNVIHFHTTRNNTAYWGKMTKLYFFSAFHI